jgi:Bifunctional DNA primase/polymerase, N-terminal/Primase C terminal 2 (PriCT-2)
MTESAMLKAALEYAKHWKVFPARMEDGKKFSWLSKDHAPGGLNWGMSDDPEQLRKNFGNKRWRDKCGIGVPTGAVNGIFVIEADTIAGHGVDGLAALRALERKHGKLPKTLMAVSPSGSVHRYYRYPDNGTKITSATLVHGVDIKASGGMVIGPPSRRGDGVYRWLNSLPIAKAPRWLLELVQEKERARSEPADYFVQFGASTRPVNIAEVTLAVAMIPNNLKTDRETWVRVGFALWDATGGSEDGYQLFAAWSRRWPDYNADKIRNAKNTRTFWDTIKTARRNITVGTIFFSAEQAVPDYRDRCIAQDPDVIALIEEFHKLMDEEE